MMPLTLAEAQDLIEQYAPREYYRDTYRRHEASYLPQWCEMLEDVPPGQVVDVGPGWATLAVWLAARGWQVDLVDFVDLGFFITERLVSDVGMRYHQCRIETDEALPGLQADLVLMTQVFGHLRYRPDNAIRRVSRFLKPGGLFVCSNLDEARHPVTEHAYADWTDMPLPGDGFPIVDDLVTCMFDLAEYKALLNGCFEEVEAWADPQTPILFAKCRTPKGETVPCVSW